MNAPASWSDTPTAQYLATLGYQEPVEFRSREQVARDWTELRGTAPTEAEVRQSMLADRLGQRVVNVPQSPLEAAADRVAADSRTQIKVLTDAEVNALADARNAAIRAGEGTIRPGSADAGKPEWNAAKGSGTPWRTITFGPSITSFETASEIVAQWQREDALEQSRSDRELAARLPGYPR